MDASLATRRELLAQREKTLTSLGRSTCGTSQLCQSCGTLAGMAQLAQLETWPTIEEAAAILGASVRTMWRHAEARRIEVRKRPRPGKKPANVVNPADIEKLWPAAFVMPEATAGSVAVQSPAAAPHPWQGALETIATILSADRASVAIGTKLWLTLDEARLQRPLAELAIEDVPGREAHRRKGRRLAHPPREPGGVRGLAARNRRDQTRRDRNHARSRRLRAAERRRAVDQQIPGPI